MQKVAWNSGVRVGQKLALTPNEVGKIKNELLSRPGMTAMRDAALFFTAIDTMLHASDLLALRVNSVMDEHSAPYERVAVPVPGDSFVTCTLSEGARIQLAKWVCATGKGHDDYLFTSVRGSSGQAISARQLSRLVKGWIESIGLDPEFYGTESLRRTRAVHILQTTGNLEAVRALLGHEKIASTAMYLGSINCDDPLDVSERCEL
jgi:integrase